VAWSPDGRHIATTSWDKAIRVWNPTTGSSHTLTGHTDALTEVAWSPDGTRIATISDDKAVRVWDPDDRHQPRHYRPLPHRPPQ
jgi:WD40 repeat protein